MSTQTALVLLVDDEYDLCLLMQMGLSRIGVKTHIAHNLAQAKHFFNEYNYQACVTDLNLPDGSGLELVKYTVQHFPNVPIAVLTGYGNMDIAITALKAGAFDFVSKPIQQQQLQQLIQRSIQPMMSTFHQPRLAHERRILIGQSAEIEILRHAIKKIANTNSPVFIGGESGTGKEVVAQLIHQLSYRHNGPFIAINCAAMAEERIESVLFGHQKGSFYGANQNKQGLFASAHGGTLFLDEIAELPLSLQAKLLRALPEQKIRPLGCDQEVELDFRILSASHQSLEHLVQQGKFRHDLFYRLHVCDVLLPPLRQRGLDILILATYFIEQFCMQWGIAQKQLSKSAQAFLLSYHYAGNVRELRNMIERALSRCDTQQIDITHLQATPRQPIQIKTPNISMHHDHVLSHPSITAQTIPAMLPEEGLEQFLLQVEREVLLNALALTRWNRTLAAKKLRMSFRSLRYRLKKLGLDHEA